LDGQGKKASKKSQRSLAAEKDPSVAQPLPRGKRSAPTRIMAPQCPYPALKLTSPNGEHSFINSSLQVFRTVTEIRRLFDTPLQLMHPAEQMRMNTDDACSVIAEIHKLFTSEGTKVPRAVNAILQLPPVRAALQDGTKDPLRFVVWMFQILPALRQLFAHRRFSQAKCLGCGTVCDHNIAILYSLFHIACF
jgi:hypothetical protein